MIDPGPASWRPSSPLRVLSRKPRVEDAGDGVVRAHALGERLRGLLLRAHPQRKRAQAAVQQVRGHRVQQAAGERAHLAQPLHPVVVRGDDAPHDVSVAAQVLRRGVEHEGGPVPRRLLQDGRGERVVDEHRNIARRGDDLGEIEEFERRVGGGLDDHEPCVGAQRRGDAVRGRPRHGGSEQPVLENVIGAAVERAHRDHVRLAGGDRGDQARRERGHAAREGHSALGGLEVGERVFESGHAGLPQPLVHRAAIGTEVVAGRELFVGEPAAVDVGQGDTWWRSRSSGRAIRSRGHPPSPRAPRVSRAGAASCPSLENSRKFRVRQSTLKDADPAVRLIEEASSDSVAKEPHGADP